MKFNPRSPRVWLTFTLNGVNLLVGILLAYLLPRRKKRPVRILLFGHHFYGNLRAIYDLSDWRERSVECRFLYIDHRKYRRHRREWDGVMGGFNVAHMIWAARADIIIADRGLGLLRILARLRPRIAAVQVWHGVGYKKHSPEEYAAFRDFRVVLAPSAAFRAEWHSDGVGPPLDDIVVTGFARTDILVRPQSTRESIARHLGLDPSGRRRVLIAPTWKQDDEGRAIVPFGMTEQGFFAAVDTWAQHHGAEVVFRIHLNTVALEHQRVLRMLEPEGFERIAFRSMDDFPRTEDLLLVSDVMVTDWSSIASDYLVLNRPIVFFDTQPPFQHGFSVLGPYDRPGPIVSSMAALFDELEKGLDEPDGHLSEYRRERERVLARAFDTTVDGMAAQRCLEVALTTIGPTGG